MTELTTAEIAELRVSLKEHFESRLQAIEKQLETANQVLDIRLAGMNEFRESMKDQQNTFLTMSEHDAWKAKIEADIQTLRDFRVKVDSKADQKTVTLAFIFSAISAVIGVIGIIEALTH